MATFWAKILLLTLNRQDFILKNYFRKIVINIVSIQIRNRNRKRNFSKVGTGIGTGTRINSVGSKTLLLSAFQLPYYTSCPQLTCSISCYEQDEGFFLLPAAVSQLLSESLTSGFL